MQNRLTEPDDRHLTATERERRNRNVLVTLLLLCSVALLFVSTLPAVLIPPAMSQLLAFASFGAAVVAAVRRERLLAEHFTHWDQAAALLGLSLFVGTLTDAAAVGSFMEAMALQAPALDSLPALPTAAEGPGAAGALGVAPPIR